MASQLFRHKGPRRRGQTPTRWLRCRELSGLDDFCKNARKFTDHRGGGERPEWTITGTMSARRYTRLRLRAQFYTSAWDHYELVLFGDEARTRQHFYHWEDIPKKIGAHTGLMMLYVNGQLVWCGDVPKDWQAIEWRVFLFGEKYVW